MEIKETTAIITEKLTGWATTAIKMLPNIGVAILIVVLFYFLAKASRYAVRKIDEKTKGNTAIMKLLGNFVFSVVFVLGLFAALSAVQLDKTVTSLLAGAGIIGLALGFAFQDTAANFLAGIIIALKRPIRLHDMVESNDEIGIVRELNLRSTILRNFQGQDIFIPNKSVLYNKIINYSRSEMRRLDLSVGVSYGEDLEKVKKITLDAVSNIPNLNSNKDKNLWFEEFGDSSINFTLAIWMNDMNQAKFRTFKSDAIMAIKKAYDENDIMIPFPIRTLDFGIKGGEKLNEMKLHIAGMAGGDDKASAQ
ncbi:mechanosensitive ion channel family protein [Cryomorpha ignava]|uniref:Mechanosensitive ion channel family protein n=1 Tax=Cryomorpha ignava TaxID=101383 RepID=A0A7K3WVI7_9FLAO|nr:mechanosensitive ion channel family protein [Cryomorpha ignava]